MLRKHKFARHSEQKEWDSYLALLIGNQRPKAPLQRAKLNITRYNYRFLDFDGLVGSCKPIVDALITNNIITDDNWGVLGAWRVEQFFVPKKDGFLLELEIKELELDP